MNKLRYPGIKPFEDEDKELFFGREEDVRQFIKLTNIEKIAVLYSKSGMGKTSMINAGLLPILEKEDKTRILKIRLGLKSEEGCMSPVDFVVDNLYEKKVRFQNFQMNFVSRSETSFLDRFAGESSDVWLALKKLQLAEPKGTRFYLIFDQFEEFFSYTQEQQKTFGDSLSEVLYSTVPQRIRKTFYRLQKDNPQFLSPEETDFMYTPIDIRVIFSMRSDSLSLMNRLRSHIPDVLKNCYELKPLSEPQAKRAIEKPASISAANSIFASQQFQFTPEAINEIFSYLTNNGEDNIESFQLQVLCHHLENEVISRNIQEISPQLVSDIRDIYKNYYDDLIARLSPEEQEKAHYLIEDGLIFEDEGRRIGLYQGQIEKKYGVDESLLNKLVEYRILRRETSPRGGSIFEISHDTLVDPILNAKKEREKSEFKELNKDDFKRERNRQNRISALKVRVSYLEKQLEDKDELIKQETQNATNSLWYAKQLQKAMFTPIQKINEILKDYFLIYSPREVVGGDFYYVNKIGNRTFLTTADCTGHGIPGAMLSMLGNVLLNEVVSKNSDSTAGYILNKVKTRFVKLFYYEKPETVVRSGMDIAMVIINHETFELQFASAMQSITIVRNGKANYIRGQRQPVFFNDAIPSFETQTFQLEVNDMLYMYSDGYYDQFGERSGKKLKFLNFRKILQNISALPTNEQKQVLDDTFKSWKGQTPRTDDVMVLGMRV